MFCHTPPKMAVPSAAPNALKNPKVVVVMATSAGWEPVY
jgi:hypothetical protein